MLDCWFKFFLFHFCSDSLLTCVGGGKTGGWRIPQVLSDGYHSGWRRVEFASSQTWNGWWNPGPSGMETTAAPMRGVDPYLALPPPIRAKATPSWLPRQGEFKRAHSLSLPRSYPLQLTPSHPSVLSSAWEREACDRGSLK